MLHTVCAVSVCGVCVLVCVCVCDVYTYVIYKQSGHGYDVRGHSHVKWLCARSSQANGRFPSELLLAFTLPWWATGGVRYGTPCCTVVVA